MKKFILTIICLFLLAPNIHADTVLLKNGGEFEGNILKVTDTHIVLDIVSDGKLLGAVMKLSKQEVESYIINREYIDLERDNGYRPQTSTDRAKDILRLKRMVEDKINREKNVLRLQSALIEEGNLKRRMK